MSITRITHCTRTVVSRLGIEITPDDSGPERIDGFIGHADQSLKVGKIGNGIWTVLQILGADRHPTLTHGFQVAAEQRRSCPVQSSVRTQYGLTLLRGRHDSILCRFLFVSSLLAF